MKKFKEYLYESGHWSAMRRGMQQASGYPPFSPMEASLWSDVVANLNDKDRADLLDYYARTKDTNVLPYDKYNDYKKAAVDYPATRAVASSSARTPRQRAAALMRAQRILRALR